VQFEYEDSKQLEVKKELRRVENYMKTNLPGKRERYIKGRVE